MVIFMMFVRTGLSELVTLCLQEERRERRTFQEEKNILISVASDRNPIQTGLSSKRKGEVIYWLKQLESQEVALASGPDTQALEPYCQDLSLQLRLSPSLVSAFPWVSFTLRQALGASWLLISQLDISLRKRTAPLQPRITSKVPGLALIGPSCVTCPSFQPITVSKRVEIC